MICHDCKHFWWMMRSQDAPYGEVACMKLQCDLWGEEVTECEHYEYRGDDNHDSH